MSDSSSSKNSQIELYTSKGLPLEEAESLYEYIESSKPGLSRTRSDALSTIYNLGYSCQDIHKMFPEYSLGLIVHAKVTYEWDLSKSELDTHLNNATVRQAQAVKSDSIRFLSELVTATHVKWRRDILRYLANPEREKAPDCLPNSLSAYRDTVSALEELAALGPDVSKKDGVLPQGGLTQLISVHVDNKPQEKTIDIKEVKDNRAASLLRQKSSEIKNAQKK